MTNIVPVDLSLTIAILALIGTILSILGFIARLIPHHQYADFCDILHDINSTFAHNDWQWPSDKRSKLWQHYRSVSANVELYHYLVTTPWYLSACHIPTAWRLRNLRHSALRLKIELIALSQIQRRKELQKIMETSLSPTDIDPPTADNTTAQTASDAASSRWWRWNKTPQATIQKTVGDCERLPV